MRFRMFKQMVTLVLPILAIFSLAISTPAHADGKLAKVKVVNQTGKPIAFVNVVHKYDDFKDNLIWSGILNSGTETSTKIVRFDTGGLNKDWWLITWVHTNADRVYLSNPNNFRGAIDKLEKIAKIGIPITGAIAATSVGVACAVATAGVCGPAAVIESAVAITGAAAAVATLVAAESLNDNSTKGFKQHNLSSEDEGELTVIYLLKNNQIRFESPSGDSETVYTSERATLSDEDLDTLKTRIEDHVATMVPDISASWTSTSGTIDFDGQTYGDDTNKTIKITSKEWDADQSAYVYSGEWGRKGTNRAVDIKKNGFFIFKFVNSCKFEGTWMYIVPEVDGTGLKINPWNGSNPSCN